MSSQQAAQPELPVILSLTNVAVSKQKALLHATQACQVHLAGSGTAASRIRQHALHTLAQSRRQTGSQADQSAAVQASSYAGYTRTTFLDSHVSALLLDAYGCLNDWALLHLPDLLDPETVPWGA